MSQHPSPGWGFGALPRRRPPALPAAGAGDVPGHRPAPRARSSPAPLSVAPTARHTHREPPPHTGRGWLQLPLAPVSPRRVHPPAESRCGCLDAHPLVAEVAVSSASCALLQLMWGRSSLGPASFDVGVLRREECSESRVQSEEGSGGTEAAAKSRNDSTAAPPCKVDSEVAPGGGGSDGGGLAAAAVAAGVQQGGRGQSRQEGGVAAGDNGGGGRGGGGG